ncbi:PHD finger protein 7-like isoform X2 [Sitodiplosis mosellana]|uniref:PHD finger protein 7-like isoform X2 n=1 Tax=Sitodiplosis mosellana TaxID=263140 RepID=UPI002445338F|nr:PHD finger protein 7-like isoform X2 [Sitodiplosis mosellana]
MTSEICIMCKQNVDDVYRFGEKITFEDVTAHYFCLLLSGYLAQKGDDNQGIFGFMPDDIKKEAKRAKTWRCKFCKKAGANISCCNTKCRKAFHLACAAEHNCRFEFVNSFQSFCDAHHDIKKPNHVHKPTDLCTICYDEMGKYNLIQSIPLPCCNKNAWCHKLCLQKYAQTSGYFLKCPLCKDSDNFRNFIAERGVFIPDRDAKWEIDDCGTNTFYDFEQHTERPSECEAKICKCHKGRNYQVDIENDKNSLVYCHYCGSHAVHLGCFKGEEFLCEECSTIVNRARENAANTSSARGDRETNSRRSAANHSRSITQTPSIAGENQSGVMGIHSEERFGGYSQSHAHLVYKFKLREFSINIKRITQKRNESSEYNESSEIQMKDERVIKPVILRNKRSIRAKRSRQNLPQNQFFDSDDTDDVGTKVDINNNCIDAELSNGSFRLKQVNPTQSVHHKM